MVADAEALPFRDRSFDLSLSSLFFHHLDRAGKASVAAEMLRVARRAALIVDLVRSRWAAVALRLLFPLLGIGRIAREDGLDVDRAWLERRGVALVPGRRRRACGAVSRHAWRSSSRLAMDSALAPGGAR